MNAFRKLMFNILNKLSDKREWNFIINKNIPFSYIVRLCLNSIVQLIYGMIRMRTIRPVLISPFTNIYCPSKIKFGRMLRISKNCEINALSKDGLIIGNNVSFGYATTLRITGSIYNLGKGVIIGNNVGLGTHGYFGGAGGLIIGDDTIFGNYVSVHPENHIYNDIDRPIRLQGVNHKGIIIGKNCWIGAKVTILDGVEIGDGCIIAAGAVVKGSFPSNCIIGGVPARIIRYRANLSKK